MRSSLDTAWPPSARLPTVSVYERPQAYDCAGNLFCGTDSCTTLLSFHVKKIMLLQDNQYLFFLSLLCLLNAVEDMFSSCIVQWCNYPSSHRFNENV
jgi:hypothetical protein